mmetsp:Transcript_19368/g.41671  ORF Transcript_19368/g.41671 Transcript_19368/m.41671 type:complete len:275 (+) Transcript_19368:513-1337(+)
MDRPALGDYLPDLLHGCQRPACVVGAHLLAVDGLPLARTHDLRLHPRLAHAAHHRPPLVEPPRRLQRLRRHHRGGLKLQVLRRLRLRALLARVTLLLRPVDHHLLRAHLRHARRVPQGEAVPDALRPRRQRGVRLQHPQEGARHYGRERRPREEGCLHGPAPGLRGAHHGRRRAPLVQRHRPRHLRPRHLRHVHLERLVLLLHRLRAALRRRASGESSARSWRDQGAVKSSYPRVSASSTGRCAQTQSRTRKVHLVPARSKGRNPAPNADLSAS